MYLPSQWFINCQRALERGWGWPRLAMCLASSQPSTSLLAYPMFDGKRAATKRKNRSARTTKAPLANLCFLGKLIPIRLLFLDVRRLCWNVGSDVIHRLIRWQTRKNVDAKNQCTWCCATDGGVAVADGRRAWLLLPKLPPLPTSFSAPC
ncbi:unnamed protein product [Caenorhabditis auriculariae]|uniref:Uncharacterized protein n=1 Tax=Caenorhabditis auriculariae TaxID=2777116 RepID=A0A8S1GYQ2_9PELO|nr:unnamed protein product [Caenorhabditis auriculariae]